MDCKLIWVKLFSLIQQITFSASTLQLRASLHCPILSTRQCFSPFHPNLSHVDRMNLAIIIIIHLIRRRDKPLTKLQTMPLVVVVLLKVLRRHQVQTALQHHTRQTVAVLTVLRVLESFASVDDEAKEVRGQQRLAVLASNDQSASLSLLVRRVEHRRVVVLATGLDVAVAPGERRGLFPDDEWNANFVGDWAGDLRVLAQDGARLDLALICWMAEE